MQLFLDCDGVLADFDKRAYQILGMDGEKFEAKHGSKAFWDTLYSTPDFFYGLDLMHDAMDLYNGVKDLKPKILTGCPRGDWAQAQKLRWRDQYFPGVEMICIESKNKRLHCNPGDVIIDDWHKYKHLWEEAGGHFILHKNASDSIIKLYNYMESNNYLHLIGR